jgi:hypothetical protein
MKISLNLSVAESFRERYGLVWTIPVAVGALGCLIYSVILAGHDVSEYNRRHRAAENMEAQVAQLRARELALRRNLQLPEYRRLLRETDFVNALIDRKQLSMTELTAKVAGLLPPEVRLTSLQFSEPSGLPFVHLSVEGNSEEALLDFENKLEQSDSFRDVTVTQTTFQGRGSPGPPSVSCSAIYTGGQSSDGERKDP